MSYLFSGSSLCWRLGGAIRGKFSEFAHRNCGTPMTNNMPCERKISYENDQLVELR